MVFLKETNKWYINGVNILAILRIYASYCIVWDGNMCYFAISDIHINLHQKNTANQLKLSWGGSKYFISWSNISSNNCAHIMHNGLLDHIQTLVGSLYM